MTILEFHPVAPLLRRAWVLPALALGALACESTFQSSLHPSTASCQVSATMASPSLSATAGSSSLRISALPECSWNIRPLSGWIGGVNPAAGQGEQQVTFTVAANTSPQARQGELAINDVRVMVRQDAAPPPPLPGPAPQPPPSCSYQADPRRFGEIGVGGATGKRVTVTTVASCPWTATTNVTWITLTAGTTGHGPGFVEFSVAPNTTGRDRRGILTVAGHTVDVVQRH